MSQPIQDIVAHLQHLEAQRKAVFGDEKTHERLKDGIGPVWDKAVETFGGSKGLAAEFLLSGNPDLENRIPADLATEADGQACVIKILARRGHFIF